MNIIKMALLLALSMVAASVSADIRVLIEYDQKAHRVLQIVEVEAKKVAPVSDHLRKQTRSTDKSTDKVRSLTSGNAAGVTVLWTANDGSLLETGTIADPRFTHTPLNDSQLRPSVIGLETGAYVVDGPAGSAFVEIQLPAHIGLGINAQSWRLKLVR